MIKKLILASTLLCTLPANDMTITNDRGGLSSRGVVGESQVAGPAASSNSHARAAAVYYRRRSLDFVRVLKRAHDRYPERTASNMILENRSTLLSKETRGWIAEQRAD